MLHYLTEPELARIDSEEGGLGERLSGLWQQRETHQSWATAHPEATLRLDHLTAQIDSLNGGLAEGVAADRSRTFDERWARMASIAQDRGLDLDLGV